jgi:hypothetical protein
MQQDGFLTNLVNPVNPVPFLKPPGVRETYITKLDNGVDGDFGHWAAGFRSKTGFTR